MFKADLSAVRFRKDRTMFCPYSDLGEPTARPHPVYCLLSTTYFLAFSALPSHLQLLLFPGQHLSRYPETPHIFQSPFCSSPTSHKPSPKNNELLLPKLSSKPCSHHTLKVLSQTQLPPHPAYLLPDKLWQANRVSQNFRFLGLLFQSLLLMLRNCLLQTR